MAHDSMPEAGDERASRVFPVEEDMPFQRATWTAQRIGWGVLAVLVVVALAGVFSIGPLSRHTARAEGGGLAVDSGRFQRLEASTSMRVVARAATAAEEVVLRIAPAFLEAFTMNSLQPPPLRAQSSSEGVDLVFAAPADGELIVYLDVRPAHPGIVRTAFALPGRAAVDLTYIIYP